MTKEDYIRFYAFLEARKAAYAGANVDATQAAGEAAFDRGIRMRARKEELQKLEAALNKIGGVPAKIKREEDE